MNLRQEQTQIQTMSMELYQSMIADMPIGVMVANSNGDFILWNDEAIRLFKEDLRTINKQAWVDEFGVYHLDRETKYETEEVPMSRALKGEFVKDEKIFIKNTATELYLKVTAYPLKDKSSQVIAGVVIFEDITKEQNMYDSVITKLKELEDYLKDILKIRNNPDNLKPTTI